MNEVVPMILYDVCSCGFVGRFSCDIILVRVLLLRSRQSDSLFCRKRRAITEDQGAPSEARSRADTYGIVQKGKGNLWVDSH